MKRVATFLFGFVLSLAVGAFAVTGGGFPSRPTFQYVGIGTPSSTGITRLQASNGGSGDVEILTSTANSGNAQFRTTDFGGQNWSFGNLRSDGSYEICNAATLTAACALNITTGGVVQSGANPVAVVTSGTFTATVTGCAANPAPTVKWTLTGKLASLTFPITITCTSNATSHTITGTPAAIIPASQKNIGFDGAVQDNSSGGQLASFVMGTGGTIFMHLCTFATNANCNSGFTGSGTFNFSQQGLTLVYSID